MELFAKKALDETREALREWEKKHEAEFKNERKTFATESGIPIKRVYTPLDLAEKGFDYLRDIGLPGEFPYTRGNSATGYRSKLWGITVYSGKPSLAESNKQWKAMVEAGAAIISVAYDLPCQLGLDPDNPKAEGEVGRVGVSMVTQKDWQVAFDGIDLNKVGIYQVFNAPAIVGLANHIALAESRGAKVSDVTGMQQNDVLKEYVARGNFIFPPAQSIRLAGDMLFYVGEYMPRYQATTVCGYHQAEKGANRVHEAAFALADAFAFIQAATDRGVDVDRIAPGVMFFPYGDHRGLFEEVAKLRAMRRIYSRVLRDRYKAKKPESIKCRLYGASGGTSLAREQYLNNIGRLTLAAFACALAGCEFIDSRTYDEGYGIPTQEACVNAVRNQNVVAYETGVDDTIDPMAGSYFIETLTCEIEERVLKELEEIERRGGIVQCIESGYCQRVIAEDGYKWQKRFEHGEVRKVGVNIFPSAAGEEQLPVRIYRANAEVEAQRRAAILEIKQKRDNRKVKKALDEIRAIAGMEATARNNLVPPVLEAVKNYATVGDICDALRDVWGEYREPSIF